jgi:DNA repair exonuclease SbcCD ATPase subunit
VEEQLVQLEANARREGDRLREAEASLRAREGELAAREREIADRCERVRELDLAEAGLRAQTACPSIEPLESALGEKRLLQSALDEKLAVLRTEVPAIAGLREREALLSACEREVERSLAAAGEDAVADDPAEAERLDREIAAASAEEQAVRRTLEHGREQLKRIEFKLTELDVLDEPVRCRIARDLGPLSARVTDYCESVRRDQRIAQEAIRIFQEIDLEEREKVGVLFGEGSRVSKWFHEISDGRYRAVHFDADDEQIEVELANGRRFPASALSGGAFDQLYLAIRASIAERMLPETRGFFLLDDPFIKADRERLRVLMRMLRRLVEGGWQVIYFTAKDEVLDALREDIDAGRVHLIEMERSLFSPPPVHGEDPLRLL